jgi:hypothetical protein
MTDTKWHNNDRLFHQELTTGQRWSTRVGERLREEIPAECGYTVTVTPMEWRESLADVARFRSEKDIVIARSGGAECVVEVKSRDLHFTDDPTSYPDHFPTAIIDTVDGWESKVHRDQVVAVVLVSQKAGGMLVVPVARTRRRWVTARRWDDKRKHSALNYEVSRRRLACMSDLVAYLASGNWEAS